MNRIGIFTIVYRIAAIIMLAMSSVAGVGLIVVNYLIKPEYHYYGNDTVSGWATIFSAFGYIGALFGKVLFAIIAFLCLAAAVYWTAGLILNHFLAKYNKSGDGSVKGVGTALAVLTMLPGCGSFMGLLSSLFSKSLHLSQCLGMLAYTAVFIGGGVYLLIAIYGKKA